MVSMVRYYVSCLYNLLYLYWNLFKLKFILKFNILILNICLKFEIVRLFFCIFVKFDKFYCNVGIIGYVDYGKIMLIVVMIKVLFEEIGIIKVV